MLIPAISMTSSPVYIVNIYRLTKTYFSSSHFTYRYTTSTSSTFEPFVNDEDPSNRIDGNPDNNDAAFACTANTVINGKADILLSNGLHNDVGYTVHGCTIECQVKLSKMNE